MLSLFSRNRHQEESGAVVAELPTAPKPVARQVAALDEQAAAKYEAVAKSVGFTTPVLFIERFKMFMAKHDLPVYDLRTVIEYMDAVAARDNATGYGWQWVALRAQDYDRQQTSFGKPSTNQPAASDYYAGKRWNGISWQNGPTYAKPVPLHALERIALIEKEFSDRVAFAVSDYATRPHIQPDPFLMAMISNPQIAEGVGRFVIDVWDEPGFGIALMLKG